MEIDTPGSCEISDATPPTDYEYKNKSFQTVRFTSKLRRNTSYTITVTFTHDPVTKSL
jgi:hypothetical protein